MKQNYHQPLIANGIYHIFSRGVGNEKLFHIEKNYFYFLQKLKFHTKYICKVFAYTLLPNHFHLLVQIEDEICLIQEFEKVKNRTFNMATDNLSDFVMERFSNLLNAYTKAFNKMYQRKGSLFMDYLKRAKANNTNDLISYIFYIHKNAVHHGYTKEIGEWCYDSYRSLITNSNTSLLRNEVIELFSSREDFIKFHQQPIMKKILIVDV